jgi:hypothetical protein
MKRVVAAMVLVCGLAAHARSTRAGEQSWSVLTGKTVGASRNVFFAQAGFPGLSLELRHGSSPTMDIGGRFTFDYGVEGMTGFVEPELKLNFVLKLALLRQSQFDLALEVDPGVAVYFEGGQVCVPSPFGGTVCSGSGGTHFGPSIPIKLVGGIPVSRNLNIDFGLDTGVSIFVTSGTSVVVPILFGGGVEYFISSRLALTFDLRMGPVVGSGAATFGMKTEIGLALPF